MGMSFGSSKTGGSFVWGKQQPYLTDLYQQAQDSTAGMDTSGQAQNAYDAAGNVLNTGTNIYNNQSMGGASGGVGGAVGGNLVSGLNQNMTGNFSSLDPYSPNAQNQYLGSSVQAGLDQITNNLTRNILPSVGSGAMSAGQYGGSRQGIAEGLALSDANKQATDYVNQMYSNNFNQIQDRGLNAATTGINAQNYAMGLGGQLISQGDQNQLNALGQTGLLSDQGFSNINKNVGATLAPQYGYSGLIGGPVMMGGGGSSVDMGGGVTEGTLTAMGLSDARMKENIHKVGKLDNGLNVYSYNYIGQPSTYIGVMAQEVEVTNPDAVSELDGIKFVDYSKAVQ